MRIISQNGYDFPYEQIVVMLDGNYVKCKPVSDFVGRHDLLGVYGTEERAEEVFREIRKTYATYNIDCIVYEMPEE